jgi:hypothetical protein
MFWRNILSPSSGLKMGVFPAKYGCGKLAEFHVTTVVHQFFHATLFITTSLRE